MRINQLKRIYMTEEGASPGGGAAPPAPAQPPATPAAPPEAPDIVSQLSKLIDDKLTAQRNGIFADLRKAGALGKEKTPETPPATPLAAPAVASPAQGMTAAEVEAMLERERAVTRATVEHKLTDAQIKRMRSALKAENPDDVSTWSAAYLADMGLAKASTPTQPAPATPVAPTAPTQPPASDKGSPAPGGVLNWEAEFAANPIGMSPAARQLMDAKHGVEKARQMRLKAAEEQAARIRVTPK